MAAGSRDSDPGTLRRPLMAGPSQLSREVAAKILQVLAGAGTPLPARGNRDGHRILTSAYPGTTALAVTPIRHHWL